MPPSFRSSSHVVWLGFASHLLAGVLPFISAGAIGRLGLMPGTAALYTAGSVIVLLSLASARMRASLRVETSSIVRGSSRTPFLLGLGGFLVAGIAYYIGLAKSPRIAEYVFLTRLDWLVQAPVAILFLKEPWTGQGLAGGALALAGGILLTSSGAIGASGVAAAAVYVLASLVGYSIFKRLSAGRDVQRALVLTIWRHWVNTAGFVLLALLISGPPAAWPLSGLLIAVAAGVTLVVLFSLRFIALTGIPLWMLAVQAPTQALVAIVVTLALGGSLPLLTYLAIAMIVAGEVIVTLGRPSV